MRLHYFLLILITTYSPLVVDAHPPVHHPSTTAWYTSPATNFTTTLPLGNGRLGAAVWGTAIENVTLNEDSLWNGSFVDRVNPDAYAAVGPVRALLAEGKITAAGQRTLRDMVGIPPLPQSYSALGALRVDFGHEEALTRNYTRMLDLRTGMVTVEYLYQGVTFRREYVASYPDDVLAVRLSASAPGRLNLVCSLERDVQVVNQTAGVEDGVGMLVLNALSIAEAEGPIRFSSQARIVAQDGRMGVDGRSIVVAGASTVEIVFDAETSYRYPSASERETALERKLQNALTKKFPGVQKDAVSDYARLSERVDLHLGSSGAHGDLPTDTRLRNYQDTPDNDPELVALIFHFGRHCLIASSRARNTTTTTSLPANLQGLWNQDYDPAWGGRFTLDINLEMNYWPAHVTNLADTFAPFLELVETIQPRGQAVARRMYHCDNGGFVLHHNTDLWGDAAPVDNGSTWTMWPMGGAWLSANLMEHYRFTQDEALLRDRIWPILRSAARFFDCYLFPVQGWLSTGPSLSPEAAFLVPEEMSVAGRAEGIDLAPTMDNALLHGLFEAVIETCTSLNITGADLERAQHNLARLRPPQINPAGRIMEWREDYTAQEPGHRHLSPIVGLYPLSQLTPLVNRTLAEAARAFLEWRVENGSGSTGWSRAWIISLYARLWAGEQAWNHTQMYVQRFVSANLWNTDSGPATVFQVDGNLGFSAAVAEMLLQSHRGVHLLPALPRGVEKGWVKGLVARGGFVVDVSWEQGLLVEARIEARVGGVLKLRVQDGRGFRVNGVVYRGEIVTVKGGVYVVTP
ncbi:glycoside hydrolase family 95 protein [Aspergillus saccharolyticus JOP 1030-1]|uniref:Alpha-L-fucosidase 2 n=1 Tax=Aspergillus saccharolyticus JOP 1030-1 TaxID=1450539 RepID=A0A318ZFP7_9EURO|nr:alpha-L-fucosidase 2 precursor [Aspergillus saccharolyticus JOP 1030-1]PYH46259.1 alpha-L-fucosidase 2 precursor [Aspergillus saccharolyticus JOP 1030-1]